MAQTDHSKRIFRNEFNGSDAYTRHKKLINDYFLFYPPKPSERTVAGKTELDVLKENHEFIRNPDEDGSSVTWEQRVAKKYYDKLFKEYAICELKYYKENKIALRWRTGKEVIAGKGQFTCASTRCDATTELHSWEVNFAYVEANERRNALVKVRLCPRCSDRLNYRTRRELARTEKEKEERRKERRKRKRGNGSDEERQSDGESGSDKEGRDGKESRRKRRRDSDSGSDSDVDSGSDSKPAKDKDSVEQKDKGKAKEDPSEVWSRPAAAPTEKSQVEEMEDYFADLLA